MLTWLLRGLIVCEVHWKWENYSSTSVVMGCMSHILLICFSLFPVRFLAAFVDLYEIHVSLPCFPVFWEFYLYNSLMAVPLRW